MDRGKKILALLNLNTDTVKDVQKNVKIISNNVFIANNTQENINRNDQTVANIESNQDIKQDNSLTSDLLSEYEENIQDNIHRIDQPEANNKSNQDIKQDDTLISCIFVPISTEESIRIDPDQEIDILSDYEENIPLSDLIKMQFLEETIQVDQMIETVADETIQIVRDVELDDSDLDPDYIPNSDAEEEPLPNTSISKGRPKRGRKRKHEGQTSTTRKKLKDSNKTHYTVKGVLKNPKEIIDFHCVCKNRCNDNISLDNRKDIFQNFYKLASYESQTNFIAACVQEVKIQRKRNKESTKRAHTRIYTLNGKGVCKLFFMNTLSISSKRINTAVVKLRVGNMSDGRGYKSGGKNKISDDTFNSVIEHINKFPRYKSHYSRNNTESLYLQSDITESKMYNLYKEENRPIVSFAKYKQIFYENFNLRRKPLVKDTCNTCDKFSAELKSAVNDTKKIDIGNQHEAHLKAAEEARKSLADDFKMASENEGIEAISFDMEKTLPLPRMPTNLVFYKRQLWLYNEGIHSGKTNKGYCFLWKEGDAGRGAQEVGSCIKKYVEDYANKNIETLIVWSDSCGGQNRNIKTVLMLKHILETHMTLKVIYMKFLVSGHSFLPNDSDFGDIEVALKFQQRVYSPDDYQQIIAGCRKRNPPIVHKMDKTDFYSTGTMESSITNRKVDINNDKISWLKSRVIKLEKSKPYSIFMKHSHDATSNYQEVAIHKIKKGRIATTPFLGQLPLLWPNGKEISIKKLKDLKDLMPFIPSDCKVFYKNLLGTDFEDDIDGYGPTLDFNVEED